MSFLKLKKSQISSAYDTSPAILPVQNVYSPHLRLSNPSLIHDAIPQRRERFGKRLLIILLNSFLINVE